ncbi:MAG: hypothetical protein A4E28_02084 [Methanocella sp. PtaU1.Bin125]|nr:MAG: hypothetical protein A4E28_02084 [Methanocella sp. PtaU1.Bin125]
MYCYRESKATVTVLLTAVLLCAIAGNLLDPFSIVRIILALIHGVPGWT